MHSSDPFVKLMRDSVKSSIGLTLQTLEPSASVENCLTPNLLVTEQPSPRSDGEMAPANQPCSTSLRVASYTPWQMSSSIWLMVEWMMAFLEWTAVWRTCSAVSVAKVCLEGKTLDLGRSPISEKPRRMLSARLASEWRHSLMSSSKIRVFLLEMILAQCWSILALIASSFVLSSTARSIHFLATSVLCLALDTSSEQVIASMVSLRTEGTDWIMFLGCWFLMAIFTKTSGSQWTPIHLHSGTSMVSQPSPRSLRTHTLFLPPWHRGLQPHLPWISALDSSPELMLFSRSYADIQPAGQGQWPWPNQLVCSAVTLVPPARKEQHQA